MELEIYSGGDLYAQETLSPENNLVVFFDTHELYLTDQSDVFGPGETVNRIYGENVRVSSEMLAKYEMDAPVQLETVYTAAETHEDWESYSIKVDVDISTLSADFSFEANSAASYIERLKEFEATGDMYLGEEIMMDILEDNNASIDMISQAADISDYVLEGPVYVGVF